MNDPQYAPQYAFVPLISGPFPVSMSDRGAAPRPTETLVFTTGDGSIVELPKRPGAFSAPKYSYRYVVDGSDHLARWEEQLPSGTGGFGFQAALEARWRVASATEVVRRNITAVADGEAAVHLAMRELLWPHAAQFGIERLSDLDAFVRSSFYGRPHILDEGLVVTSLTVRLYLDPVAADHLRNVKQREFDRQLAAAQHDTDKAVQGYQAELQTRREEAILAAARGEGGLILMMIAQDPSKMREILADLGDRHEVAVSHKMQVLKDLIEAKLIQPAEAQTLWQEMNRPTPLLTGSPQALTASPGPSPAPAGPPPRMLAGATTPSSSTPPAPRFQGGGGGANNGGGGTGGNQGGGNQAAGANLPGATVAGPGPGQGTRPAPVPSHAARPGAGAGAAPGTGASTPATGPGNGAPAPAPAPKHGGSQSPGTGNVVGATPVGRGRSAPSGR